MRVLMIDGDAAHQEGVRPLLDQMQRELAREGIGTERVELGPGDLHACMGCGHCALGDGCMLDDAVNRAAPLFARASGMVVVAPLACDDANGSVASFLDRLFRSTDYVDKEMKVGSAVALMPNGGMKTTCDALNRPFFESGMPIATCHHDHGVASSPTSREMAQQARELARNLAFLMRSIELGKREYGLPVRSGHDRGQKVAYRP